MTVPKVSAFLAKEIDIYLNKHCLQVKTRKLTAEGQRFSFRRVLTSSMHIPFHIPFLPTLLVVTSSVHLG